MIFVTLGTQDQKMYRLLDLLESSKIKDEIIVQAGGSSDYSSKKMKIQAFYSMKEIDELIKQADLIICHGGAGSLISALKANKKVLAMPRLKKYGEHIDDHQVEIVSSFEDQGYIKIIHENDNIDQLVKSMDKFVPKPFVSNQHNFIDKLKKEIER